MNSNKMRNALLASAAAVVVAGTAVAQIVSPTTVAAISSTDLVQDIPTGVSQSTNVYATVQQIKSWVLGQNSQHLTTPTLTTSNGCGGASATISGTDVAGQITEGTTNETTCVMTFAKNFVAIPECFVSLNNVADTALKCSASLSNVTITQSSANSEVANYLIVGLPGG